MAREGWKPYPPYMAVDFSGGQVLRERFLSPYRLLLVHGCFAYGKSIFLMGFSVNFSVICVDCVPKKVLRNTH